MRNGPTRENWIPQATKLSQRPAFELPGQQPAETVRLLRLAIRSDGTNPKHAYFLARFYFVHGHFDQASRWLREAVRHCPTSHRIWSHIALLQRELNQRYSGNDAYEPDELRFRSAEIIRRILLGSDSFTPDFLEFQPRESTKKKQERKAAKAFDSENEGDEGEEGIGARDASAAQEETPGNIQPTSKRLTDSGRCRWSGAADLTLEAILEGAASDLVCHKARPLLQQAARLAAERQGGTAAFVVLGIDWCIAGLPVETVEYLRRTFPPDLDTPSLRLLDFICSCFRISESEVPQVLSDALANNRIPPTLAAVVHHRRLLWYSLDPRTFSKHSAGRRWLTRYRNSKEDVTVRSEAMVRAISQAASFAPKSRLVLTDPVLTSATSPPDWINAITLIQEAATKIETIADAAAVLTAIHRANCTDLVRALEKAADRTSIRLDDLLAAAFETVTPDGFHSAASHCRRILNRLLYLSPLAARFPPLPANAPAGQELSEIAKWFKEADGLFPKSSTENGTIGEQLEALEAGVRKAKAQLDNDLEKFRTELKSKKNGPLSTKIVAECFDAKARSEEIIASATTKIREIGEFRATGKVHEWTPEEKESAQQEGRTLQPSEVDRLNEAERAWRGVAALQGPFRKIIAQLDLPKPTAAQAPVVGSPEDEHPVSGIPSVEQALSQFETQVEGRFAAALETFACYTPSQRAEPALASLIWSARVRQAEALLRLGKKSAARRIWGRLLAQDRLSVPVLKNVAVSLTGGSQVGFELNAWREYAEMLYFQDCIQNSPRPNAAARATFHKDFGSAYAPECFLATRREGALTDEDEISLVSFLESGSRVRTYVTHEWLEWLNRKLDFASPTLVLGCDRSESESTRALAAKKLLAFAEVCCNQLPSRAGANFCRLSHVHISAAREKCKDLRNIPEDSVYVAERLRQLEWVREIAMLKLRIGDCILGSKELPRRISSPAIFDELLRLDEVPIDLSPDILSSVHRNSDALVHYMSTVREHFLRRFAEFLDNEGGEKSLQSIRERQFSRLTDEWIELPSVRGSLSVINLLVKRLEEALKKKQYEHTCKLSILILRADDRRANVARLALVKFLNAVEEAQQCMFDQELVAEVADWIKRARARLASHPPDKDEENPLSEEAISQVVADLLHVLAKLLEVALKDTQYERACQLSILILRMDDRRANYARLALVKFLEVAEKAQQCMLHRELAAEVAAWIKRAQTHLASHPSDQNAENSLSEEAIGEVSDDLLQVLTRLFLAPYAGVTPAERMGRLEQPLDELVREHPATRPIRMLKYWEFVGEASKNKRRDELLHWIRCCKPDVKAVLSDPTIAKKYRDFAETINAQIQTAGI